MWLAQFIWCLQRELLMPSDPLCMLWTRCIKAFQMLVPVVVLLSCEDTKYCSQIRAGHRRCISNVLGVLRAVQGLLALYV